jgi:hypothetical protein
MSDIAKSQEVFHETAQEVKRLRKLQRRFQIEIIIAVGFICLVIGFLAGASWHYLRVKGKDSVIVVEPATKPLQATDAVDTKD